MADNVAITAGSGTNIATDEVTGTGEHVQLVKLAISADGSRGLIPADGTNGLEVDVSRIQTALPAGTNNIGSVGITDGTNAVVVDTTAADNEAAGTASLVVNSRLKLYNGTGWDRVRGDITNGLDVDVTRLPALPTGSNIIGQVQITNGSISLPIDTAHNDGESATENHLDVAAKIMGLNGAGTFDIVRANVSQNRTAQYATAQTGVALWTPAAGRAVVITSLQIQVGGTVAGAVQVWFGGAADTTYTRGTDFPIFDGEFAPSNTNKPGVYVTFPVPIRGTADFVLRVTTGAAINPITVSVWGYEI